MWDGMDVCPSHILESLHSLNAICLSETVSFCRLWITDVLLGFLKHIAGRLTCPRPWVGIKSMSGFTVFQQIQPHEKYFSLKIFLYFEELSLVKEVAKRNTTECTFLCICTEREHETIQMAAFSYLLSTMEEFST